LEHKRKNCKWEKRWEKRLKYCADHIIWFITKIVCSKLHAFIWYHTCLLHLWGAYRPYSIVPCLLLAIVDSSLVRVIEVPTAVFTHRTYQSFPLFLFQIIRRVIAQFINGAFDLLKYKRLNRTPSVVLCLILKLFLELDK
jgi:hypothetical protein